MSIKKREIKRIAKIAMWTAVCAAAAFFAPRWMLMAASAVIAAALIFSE